MKKTVKFLFSAAFTAVMLCAFSLCVSAATSGTCGENLMWDLTDGVLTISGTGEMTNWSESSNPPWYELRSSINSVKIEDGVTTVGVYAFSGCTEVTDVSISNSVTVIRGYALADCVKLNDITIPDSVNKMYACVFENCIGLTDVTIPDSVTQINSGVFKGCSNLQKVTLPFVGTSRTDSGIVGAVLGHIFGYASSSSETGTTCQYYTSSSSRFYYIPSSLREVVITDATQIPYGAFYNCSMLTSITIPEGVTSIGSSAFYNCTGLTEITIPNSVTSIEKDAFHSCTALTKVNINDIEKWLNISFKNAYGNPVFYAKNLYVNGELLTELTIPDGITEIKSFAFYNCSELANVTIPDGVISIGKSAFLGCKGSNELVIPNSVQNIKSYAFKGWNNLEKITIPFIGSSREASETKDSVLGHIFGYASTSAEIGTTCQCYTSSSSRFYYIPSSLREVVITDATQIPYGAFYGCNMLTNITIPEGVKSIDSYAFHDCTSFTSINIPNTVTSIYSGAFENCTNLTSVYIDDLSAWCEIGFGSHTSNPVYYAKNLYLNNELLTNLIIPDDITVIKSYAFANCINITDIAVHDSVTGIGTSAFSGCSKLEKITVPDSVTSIGKAAFSGCSNLKKITLPFVGGSRTSSGEWAVFGYIFGYDSSSTIPVTSQWYKYTPSGGYGAPEFDSYAKNNIPVTIKEVVITDDTTISNGAFNNCKNITSIYLMKQCVTIGTKAFDLCSSLTDVYYNGTKSEWNKVTKSGISNATLHCITPPELDINLLRSFAYNYDSEAQTIAINAYDSEKTAGFGVSAEGISYRKITTDSGNGVSATVVDGVRHFVVKQANGANQSFNIYVEDNNGKKHPFEVTLKFTAEDYVAIEDIATLRCYNAKVSEENRTITVDIDRNDVLSKLGSIGVAVIAPEGVTVSYEYLSDNGGEDSTSGFTETKTDKYTLMSDGVNNETGGGSFGKIAMKIFKKSNGTRMNVKVTLSDGVISTEYAMQIRISDVSVEDYVDIMDVKPLRADPDSFIVDNELKEIYFETLPGVSSAGFAVSVDNGLTKATRHRRLLTAQSGKSLAHGDIKDATEADIYDRYVVARRSVGKTQNFRVKVAGGEDGRAYTWYTVTVVFK